MRATSMIATILILISSGLTQTRSSLPASQNQTQFRVPRVIQIHGALNEANGQPQNGTVGITLSLYSEQTGGAALWQEFQNVTLDSSGHYTVLLGANTAEGLPLDLFTSGEARWLGVQMSGFDEQPRTLMVAVPYALKAADAETLGGKPVSAFITTDTNTSLSHNQTSVVNGGSPSSANVTGSGSQNVIPKFDASGTNLIGSILFDDGTHLGVGTQSPSFQFDAQNTDASAAGANLFRIQTPSVNGATMHFISTSANGRHFGFGSNFILGVGEFGIYDYTPGSRAARLWIDANGTVGVGTFGGGGNFTRPAYTLDVQNTDSSGLGQHIFRIQTPSSNGAVMHLVSTSANGRDWAFGSNFILGKGEFGIYDYTANANRIFINGTGNVGIGTTTPSQALEVSGNLKSSGLMFPDGTTMTSGNSVNGALTVLGGIQLTVAGQGIVVKSPDGTKCKQIGIDNSGNLNATAVACP